MDDAGQRLNWNLIGCATCYRTVDYRDLMTIEPGKMGGKTEHQRNAAPSTMSSITFVDQACRTLKFCTISPMLTSEDIRASLAFAADRERRLAFIPV